MDRRGATPSLNETQTATHVQTTGHTLWKTLQHLNKSSSRLLSLQISKSTLKPRVYFKCFQRKSFTYYLDVDPFPFTVFTCTPPEQDLEQLERHFETQNQTLNKGVFLWRCIKTQFNPHINSAAASTCKSNAALKFPLLHLFCIFLHDDVAHFTSVSAAAA